VKLFLVAAIAGLVILCGAGNQFCFADTGSGVSIQLITTVIGGDSGGGYHNWSSGNGSYYVPSPTKPQTPSPYLPLVTNAPPPIPPTYPTYNNEPLNIPPAIGQTLPQESTTNFVTGFLIIIGIGLALLLFGTAFKKIRSKALLKKRQQVPPFPPIQPQ